MTIRDLHASLEFLPFTISKSVTLSLILFDKYWDTRHNEWSMPPHFDETRLPMRCNELSHKGESDPLSHGSKPPHYLLASLRIDDVPVKEQLLNPRASLHRQA